MKILITGSSGHLGTALSIVLNKTKHQLVGTDLMAGEHTHLVGDLADKKFVQTCMKGVDVVFHTATLHKPHIVTHSKQRFIDTNINGTLHLLESAVEAKVKAFIFTSTTSTFGDAMQPSSEEGAVWVTEKLVPIPKNIYGVTKIAAENLCKLFARNHQLPCLILKTSRFFAEADDNKLLRANYVDANIKANELLYRRVDIQDVVDAHLLAMEKALGIGFGKYIISATTPFTITHLKALQKDTPKVLTNIYPDFSLIYAKENWKMFPKIGRVYVNEKARKELGWQPKYDFAWVLACLKNGVDFRSPLAKKIGIRGYHQEKFTDGIYPV